MGQLAIGSLWGYGKYLIISIYLLFEISQPIVFEIDNKSLGDLLQICLRFFTGFTFFFITVMKIETFTSDFVLRREERKKLKLENELLEEQLKKLKDENP